MGKNRFNQNDLTSYQRKSRSLELKKQGLEKNNF